jgi:cysteinyl-tRNA synthetase
LAFCFSSLTGVTDIDDKIIKKGKDLQLKSWSEYQDLIRGYESKFFSDMDQLNIMRPDSVLRVTDHIDEIIHYVKRIEEQGFTYTTPQGVYFDITKFSAVNNNSYGKLGEREYDIL